jgi:hypothetical protein
MLMNLINQTFGRLTVLRRGRIVSLPGNGTKVYWRCRCQPHCKPTALYILLNEAGTEVNVDLYQW